MIVFSASVLKTEEPHGLVRTNRRPGSGELSREVRPALEGLQNGETAAYFRTMIYAHVPNQAAKGVKNPADKLCRRKSSVLCGNRIRRGFKPNASQAIRKKRFKRKSERSVIWKQEPEQCLSGKHLNVSCL